MGLRTNSILMLGKYKLTAERGELKSLDPPLLVIHNAHRYLSVVSNAYIHLLLYKRRVGYK